MFEGVTIGGYPRQTIDDVGLEDRDIVKVVIEGPCGMVPLTLARRM